MRPIRFTPEVERFFSGLFGDERDEINNTLIYLASQPHYPATSEPFGSSGLYKEPTRRFWIAYRFDATDLNVALVDRHPLF